MVQLCRRYLRNKDFRKKKIDETKSGLRIKKEKF
jgi:hypothetical protein